MIVETSSNQLYRVEPAEGIDHAWIGVEVKRAKGGGYTPKAKPDQSSSARQGQR
jgi:hypothetical protein